MNPQVRIDGGEWRDLVDGETFTYSKALEFRGLPVAGGGSGDSVEGVIYRGGGVTGGGGGDAVFFSPAGREGNPA